MLPQFYRRFIFKYSFFLQDLCPQSIEGNTEKFGLKNTGSFTRSHCACDNKFYECLKNANSLVSNQIGMVYFNVLGPQCFLEDKPQICEHQTQGRCVRYGVDESQPKKYQWIDNKWYI